MPANPFFQGLRGNTSDPAHARNPDLPRADGPTERWSRQQDQLATERGSRSTDVHTRADDGTPLINGRPASDYSGRRDATTPTAAPADAPTTENRIKPLSDVGPEKMIRVADGVDVPESEYREVAAEIAARKSGQLSAPKDANGYEPALPKDFVIPEGSNFKFNPQDARIPKLQAWAHKHGLGVDAFQELIGIGASYDLDGFQNLAAARAAEESKLGPTASARMSAVNHWLSSMLGEADARHLQDAIWTAAAARSWEKLMAKVSGGSGSRYSHAHRDGGPSDSVDDATYDKWSVAQRLNYARTGNPDRAR